MENQEQQAQPPMPVQPAPQPIQATFEPTKKSLLKLLLIIVGLILILVLIGGAFVLGKNMNSTQKLASKTVQTPTTVPTPIIDTSTWKTYTSNNLGFSFKYPIDWREELATSDGPVYKYYNLTLKRDGYQINIKINLYGVGGATNRYVAKAEIANINNLASTTKAYINMNLASCTFDSQTSPSIPPSACTNTFDEISILNSYDIKNTDVENSNVITTTREYPCFVDPTHRFEISLTTPAPINISDINSNAYISTYNQILSTFKFNDQTDQSSQTEQKFLNIPEFGVKIPLSSDIYDAYYLPNSVKTENNISWIYLKVHSLDSEKYCNQTDSGIVALNKVGKDQIDERTGSKYSDSGNGTLIGNDYYFMDQEQAVCSQNSSNVTTETSALKAFLNAATNIQTL